MRTAVAQWLRCCATNRKVAGSIPDGVIGIFHWLNPLTPNDHYSGRTAPLTPKRCILYIYSTNTGTEYFKHGIYSHFFSLQNVVCFIILTYLVPVLFTFYIQGVLKLKKNNSGAKRLKSFRSHYGPGVDSASNRNEFQRNEYQEHFLVVKAAGE